MKVSSFLIQICSLSAMVIFAGCASSSYSKFYQENPQVKQLISTQNSGFVFLADGEEPQLISTNDIEKDMKGMISKRYIPIGASSFNGELEGVKAIQAQAKRIKAVAVLYTSKFTNTQTNSGTLLLPQTNYYSGNVNAYNAYGSGYGTYSGSSTTTMAVPYSNTQRRFDQSAVFFIKDIQPVKFGLGVNDITRDKRIEIGRDGVVVVTILENTPVYKSNLLEGDVIIEFDGKQVGGAEEFQNSLKNFDTSKGFCDFKVLRNGAEQIVRIKFS